MKHNVQQVIEHFAGKGQKLCLTDDGRVYAQPKGISADEGAMLDAVQGELIEALRVPPFRTTRTIYAPPVGRKKPKEQTHADKPQAGTDVQGDPFDGQGTA